MKKLLLIFSVLCMGLFFLPQAQAAYQSRFDAINFDPAVDGGNYITVYGSKMLKPWQGDMGFYFDYANRPLEFRSTGGVNGRQSVLDHSFIVDAYGALGFTDWFSAGFNIPFVPYSVYYTDDINAQADHGGGMGDMMIMTKFRFIDIDKHHVGFAIVPFVTFPTGDVVRYDGNGSLTGGLKLIVDFRLHERFEMSFNAGGLMRDDVTRNYTFPGGATSSVRVDDMFTFGWGGNIKFTRNFQGIVEAQGSTLFRSFFSNSNTNSLEAGAGVRYYIGDTGFAIDAGGTAGLLEGVGTPRFRGYLGLRWTSPVPQPCPECNAPDPRIQGDKIVLWGKIFYDTAKATIKPISYPVLDDVVDVLNTHPDITLVEVQGHTDARGSDPYNMKLSQARSESALQYLISKGIDPSRLRAVGYGESRPIASNDTVEGMSQNRRTEFVIISSTSGAYKSQFSDGSAPATMPVVDSGSTPVIDSGTVPVVNPMTGNNLDTGAIPASDNNAIPEVDPSNDYSELNANP